MCKLAVILKIAKDNFVLAAPARHSLSDGGNINDFKFLFVYPELTEGAANF
jgi:hypothetical protein